MKAYVARNGTEWVVILDYGRNKAKGERQGFWVEDSLGGWGTSMRAALLAIHECAAPRTYATEEEAVAAAELAVDGGEVVLGIPGAPA